MAEGDISTALVYALPPLVLASFWFITRWAQREPSTSEPEPPDQPVSRLKRFARSPWLPIVIVIVLAFIAQKMLVN
jgi:hypothetical protein